jgi:hypothetical protein
VMVAGPATEAMLPEGAEKPALPTPDALLTGGTKVGGRYASPLGLRLLAPRLGRGRSQ